MGVNPSLFAKNVWELGGNPSKWGMYEGNVFYVVVLNLKMYALWGYNWQEPMDL